MRCETWSCLSHWFCYWPVVTPFRTGVAPKHQPASKLDVGRESFWLCDGTVVPFEQGRTIGGIPCVMNSLLTVSSLWPLPVLCCFALAWSLSRLPNLCILPDAAKPAGVNWRARERGREPGPSLSAGSIGGPDAKSTPARCRNSSPLEVRSDARDRAAETTCGRWPLRATTDRWRHWSKSFWPNTYGSRAIWKSESSWRKPHCLKLPRPSQSQEGWHKGR